MISLNFFFSVFKRQANNFCAVILKLTLLIENKIVTQQEFNQKPINQYSGFRNVLYKLLRAKKKKLDVFNNKKSAFFLFNRFKSNWKHSIIMFIIRWFTTLMALIDMLLSIECYNSEPDWFHLQVTKDVDENVQFYAI